MQGKQLQDKGHIFMLLNSVSPVKTYNANKQSKTSHYSPQTLSPELSDHLNR